MFRSSRCLIYAAVAILASGISSADNGPEHRVRQSLPIKLGSSGGNANDPRSITDPFTGIEHPCLAWTLGSAVTCAGVLHVLSSNAVFACYGPPAGEEVIHPGLEDLMPQCIRTPVNSDVVADFVGDLVPLGTRAGTSTVTAAIAAAREGAVDPSGAILDVGVPCSKPKHWHTGLSVAKSGQATGFTTGTILAGFFDLRISAVGICTQEVVLTKNQFLVTPGFPDFVNIGDIGSLIVTNDADHRPVGLLIALSRAVAVGTPIGAVVEAFEPFCGGQGGFRFVGRDCSGTESSETGLLSPSAWEIERARQVKERHVDWLMSMRRVLGVGVGASERDPGKAAIMVLMDTGRRQNRWIPSELEGVEVRKLLSDPIHAL